jgi:hypothetical protein
MRHAFRVPQSEFRIRADAYGQVTILNGDGTSPAVGSALPPATR